ncbi:SusD/RagB family nutrient-binding outer membrane lipoprotein [Sphingobacterium bovistauri]|uniref:SusD/RagB family nutrient-binding outer membrane lipoprotein n=1 Tax=Sphingobacterium bovistauri TaxID=2781959 RepID=A0ABS7Z867_9SPHI|nr:SusD/RagB family nutrient-binding outer membrane lipoprotein [Sphingobacterium bovistauri]MCA5006381.1 SusD/RagB family nutrient-binding outer membrane lipoprotein [Sphingobacterium bovistauri]
MDINIDPNKPTNVPENMILPGLQSNFSFEVIGGYAPRVTSLWTKHLAYATDGPHEGLYALTANDVDNLWTSYSYANVMNNASDLIQKANENGNLHYSAIAKIILAWNISIITDLFGDAPLSEAMRAKEGIFTPSYDSQEEIYKQIQKLLDEAIVESQSSNNKLMPTSDDLIYGGNMSNWKNLAHSLKARFYLRLTNAPTYNAATQAILALEELAKGHISIDSQPLFKHYSSTGAENPWYQYAIDGKWTKMVRPSQYYVNLLSANNDPRLAVQIEAIKEANNVLPDNIGKYIGVVNDLTPIAIDNYSEIGKFHSEKDAPLNWFNYSEVEFIKAEAEFLKSNKIVTETVKSAYNKAVKSAMDYYAIPSDVSALYLSNNLLDPNTAYAQIMTQKYIANYLQLESYNDFRRTGYPNLNINNESYPNTTLSYEPRLDKIPVRFPYPSSERQYNQSNIPSEISIDPLKAMLQEVWWDK